LICTRHCNWRNLPWDKTTSLAGSSFCYLFRLRNTWIQLIFSFAALGLGIPSDCPINLSNRFYNSSATGPHCGVSSRFQLTGLGSCCTNIEYNIGGGSPELSLTGHFEVQDFTTFSSVTDWTSQTWTKGLPTLLQLSTVSNQDLDHSNCHRAFQCHSFAFYFCCSDRVQHQRATEPYCGVSSRLLTGLGSCCITVSTWDGGGSPFSHFPGLFQVLHTTHCNAIPTAAISQIWIYFCTHSTTGPHCGVSSRTLTGLGSCCTVINDQDGGGSPFPHFTGHLQVLSIIHFNVAAAVNFQIWIWFYNHGATGPHCGVSSRKLTGLGSGGIAISIWDGGDSPFLDSTGLFQVLSTIHSNIAAAATLQIWSLVCNHGAQGPHCGVSSRFLPGLGPCCITIQVYDGGEFSILFSADFLQGLHTIRLCVTITTQFQTWNSFHNLGATGPHCGVRSRILTGFGPGCNDVKVSDGGGSPQSYFTGQFPERRTLCTIFIYKDTRCHWILTLATATNSYNLCGQKWSHPRAGGGFSYLSFWWLHLELHWREITPTFLPWSSQLISFLHYLHRLLITLSIPQGADLFNCLWYLWGQTTATYIIFLVSIAFASLIFTSWHRGLIFYFNKFYLILARTLNLITTHCPIQPCESPASLPTSSRRSGKPGPKSGHTWHRGFSRLSQVLLALLATMTLLAGYGGEGRDPVMGVTGTSDYSTWPCLPTDVKQHDERPPARSDLQSPSLTAVKKRSLKRAQKRAALHGVAWYQGRLYRPADFHFMPLCPTQTCTPCTRPQYPLMLKCSVIVNMEPNPD